MNNMNKTLKKTLKTIGYVLLGIFWTLVVLAAFTAGAVWLIGAGYQH